MDVAARLQREGVQSVAVGFLQSYVNPAHEQRVRELLKQHAPSVWVTLSSDVCPEVREYERFSTTCANAYVQPVMAGYLQRLEARLQGLGLRCPVYLMTSGGALTTMDMEIVASAWPQLANKVIAEVIQANIAAVGLPKWTEADQKFAREFQTSLGLKPVGLKIGRAHV